MPGKSSYPTMSNLWLCVHATNYHCDFATHGSMLLCHPSPGELSDSIQCQCPVVWVSQGHGMVWNSSTVRLFHAGGTRHRVLLSFTASYFWARQVPPLAHSKTEGSRCTSLLSLAWALNFRSHRKDLGEQVIPIIFLVAYEEQFFILNEASSVD